MPDDDAPVRRLPPDLPGGQLTGYDDEISLEPLFGILWSYRRVWMASVGALIVLFVLGTLRMYLISPAERHASLEFRVVFDGATLGEYPSGLRFAASEIIADAVLINVFAADELDRYMSYARFKSRLAVIESPNAGLELLTREYRERSEGRLALTDRIRLQEEYRQQREALKQPLYTLSFIDSAGTSEVPSALLNKVLRDILAAWAEEAIERRRVLRYQVELPTPDSLLSDFISRSHPFVKLDVLRRTLNRSIGALDEVASLPGAGITTVGDGAERVSLEEVSRRFEDLLNVGLRPLMIGALTAGTGSDRQFFAGYVESRLLQSRMDRAAAAARLEILREALQAYQMVDRGFDTARSRRITDPLLDRIVALSVEATDLPYRRRVVDSIISAGDDTAEVEREIAEYQEMLAWALGERPNQAVRADLGSRAIGERVDAIQVDIEQALRQAEALLAEISMRNLNPGTALYSVVDPFIEQTERTVTLWTIVAYAVLLLIVSLTVVPLACVVHHWARRLAARQSLRGRTAPDDADLPRSLEATPSDLV